MHDESIRHQGGVRTYWLLASLALVTCFGEIGISFLFGILALRVDGIHTFGDALAIGLAIWLEARHDHHSAEDNHRLQIRFRVIIGIIILIAGVHSGMESIERWKHPGEIIGLAMIFTAALCAGLNRAMIFVLGACPCDIDIHLRTHVRSDFWVSVGIAGSGLAVLVTGYWWIEPLTSSFISIRIVLLGFEVALGLHKD